MQSTDALSMDSYYQQYQEEQYRSLIGWEGNKQGEPRDPQEPPSRVIRQLGIFGTPETGQARWIAISATNQDYLGHSVEQAKRKGWEPLPLYQGNDPETGWLCVWMCKPVEENT